MKPKKASLNKKKPRINASNITRLVSFGNLHLMFTLNLSNDWLIEHNIDFGTIETIQDLAFINNNKAIWKDVVLTSNNNSMNFLLQVNKCTKIKIFFEYVVLDKIIYNEEQKTLTELVTYVTETNFLFIKETEASPCNTDMIFYLSNGDKVKSFNLCESKNLSPPQDDLCYEDNVDQVKSPDGKQENDDNQAEQSLENCSSQPKEDRESVNNTSKTKNSNQKERNELLYDRKQRHKRLEETVKNKDKKEEKDNENNDNPFGKLYDFNFIDFDYIYIDLNDLLNSEIASSVSLTDFTKFFEHLKLNTNIQIIVNFPDLTSKSVTTEDIYSIDQILLLTDVYLFERKTAYLIFNTFNKLINQNDSNLKDLDKRNDIQFFVNEICYQCPIDYKLKLGLFMDEFIKISIVQVNPNTQPFVNELDAMIYPKINHYNMKNVEIYKTTLNYSYEKYYTVFYGAMIGKLIQGEFNEKRIYLAYLTGIESAKKILEINKNGINMPKTKKFYLVKLHMDMINKNMQMKTLQQREKQFVLDCINEEHSKLKYYNPLFDYHLNSYFSSSLTQKELKSKGFINGKGYIMYDSVYKERQNNSLQKRKNDTNENEHILVDTIQNIKVGSNVSNKELDPKEIARSRNSPTRYKLVNSASLYSVYNKSHPKRSLPPIKQHKSKSTQELL